MYQRRVTSHMWHQHPRKSLSPPLAVFLCYPPSLHVFVFWAKQAGEVVWGMRALKQKHSNTKGAGVWKQGESKKGWAWQGKKAEENTKSVLELSCRYTSTHTYCMITRSMSEFSFQTNDYHISQVQCAAWKWSVTEGYMEVSMLAVLTDVSTSRIGYR